MNQIPYNPDAEQAVIASILLSPDSLYEVDLDAAEFFNEINAQIYAELKQIAKDGETPDILTLAARTKDNSKWLPYIQAIANSVPSASLIRQYADMVRRERIKRDILNASTQIAEIAYNSHDVETSDLIPHALGKLNRITTPEKGVVIPIAQAIAEYMPTLENYLDEQNDVWGIETGLDIDKYIGGLIGGDLTLVAGRAGKGKTSLGMQAAFHAAQCGQATLVFSLEMIRRQYMLRMLSTLSGVNSEQIRRGRIARTGSEYQRIKQVSREISQTPLWIVDTPQSTDSIHAHIAKLKQRGVELKFVVIDYNDMLQDRGDNEITRAKQITRAEKQIARKHDVCVWALHAVNRDADLSLRSLLYGGDFDADEVVLCNFEDGRTDDTAELLIVKNRNGDTCKVPMLFNGQTTQWRNPVRTDAVATKYTWNAKAPTWEDLPQVPEGMEL